IQDALNLSWKLAAVVKGDAGPALLDSYETERLPLCQLNVEQAYTRYASRVVPERGTDGVQPPVPDIELEIGLVARSPVILPDGEDDGALHLAPAALDGRPGTRAPHVVLPDGRSTLDLFGSGLVLLRAAGDGVDDWAPDGVDSHVIDSGSFAENYGLSAGGAVLVRPDGVVAWRSRGLPSRPSAGTPCASESRSRTCTRRWRSEARSRRSPGWPTSSGSTRSGATTTSRSPLPPATVRPNRPTRRPTASSGDSASMSR